MDADRADEPGRRAEQRGAASQPAARPVPAAASPITRYSARWMVAIMAGPAPTALSRPTRRRWPMARPATMPATPVTARAVSSQLPISRACRAGAFNMLLTSAICGPVRKRHPWNRASDPMPPPGGSTAATPACGSVSLRFTVYDSGWSPASVAMSLRSTQTRPPPSVVMLPGSATRARIRGPGGRDREPGDVQRVTVDADRVAGVQVKGVGEGAFDDDPPGVSRCRR
ncbi:hypothetical protein NKG94_28240 [Micromonospora sp. M12]